MVKKLKVKGLTSDWIESRLEKELKAVVAKCVKKYGWRDTEFMLIAAMRGTSFIWLINREELIEYHGCETDEQCDHVLHALHTDLDDYEINDRMNDFIAEARSEVKNET